MSLTVSQLIEKLQGFPDNWRVYATRQGNSLEVWEPGGHKYIYVFTDERPTREFTARRPLTTG